MASSPKQSASQAWGLRRVGSVVALFLALAVLSVIIPETGEAFFPTPRPPQVGSPPVYDAGYRAWQHSKYMKSWWKRDRSLKRLPQERSEERPLF